MNPLYVCLVAVEFLHNLALLQWDGELDWGKFTSISLKDLNVYIYVANFSKELQPRHLALALRQAVFDMAQKLPGWYEVWAQLNLRQRPLGGVYVTKNPNLKPPSINNANISESVGIKLVAVNSSLAAESGEIVDPADPRFMISWQYEGPLIPPDEFFTAWLDAQIIAASHSRVQTCDQLTAYSASGKTVLAITRKPGVQALYHHQVTSALYLIVLDAFMSLATAQCGEMGFIMSYSNVVIGTGVIFSPRPVGQGDDTQGTANSSSLTTSYA